VAVGSPARRYTSSAFAGRGHERLPGDFHELRVGPLSVLVVRGDNGEVRALQNAWRRRGSALCEGTGLGLTQIRWPFNRWTYDLTGRLRVGAAGANWPES
jgi:phenylpropionate dioxygenase-like ring-hydroxylating dioxygenase large terminal subunit